MSIMIPLLSFAIPYALIVSTTTHQLQAYLYLPTVVGSWCIGYLISAVNTAPNALPLWFLQTDHPYGRLIYFRNKSFAFQLAPLLPTLLFFFTSLVYIEYPERIGRGVGFAVCGMVFSQAVLAYYFSREIGEVRDQMSARLFRTGLLRRFTTVNLISFTAIAVFFYTIFFSLSENRSVELLSPIRLVEDVYLEYGMVQLDWRLLSTVFGLAALFALINLKSLRSKKDVLTKKDYFLIGLSLLLWASALNSGIYFVTLMHSLADPVRLSYSLLSFLLHQAVITISVLFCSCFFLFKKNRLEVKALKQPVWRFHRGALIGFVLLIGSVFVASLYAVESSYYAIAGALALFAAIALSMASRQRLENIINERTSELNIEKVKVENLLGNILPSYVIEDLKNYGESRPKAFENVAVLFTDFVGFTKISSMLEPQELIAELNEMFTAFDAIVKENNSERIKTIGDAYMAVSGLHAGHEDPAGSMLECARQILAYIRQRNERQKIKWEIRIGVAIGRSVGGVVGKTKYLFDLFGDTINTAARMESNSEPMRINVSQELYDLLKNRYRFIERPPIEVKGKGKMTMYFLNE